MNTKKIFRRDFRAQSPIFCVAESVLENVEERVSKELYDNMKDYLLGFTDDMQLEIADDLLDAVCHGWEHYTGIRHIDEKLNSFYQLIDEEVGGQYIEDNTNPLLEGLKEALLQTK